MTDSSPGSTSPAPPASPLGKMNFSTKLAFGAGDLGSAITANLLIFYLSPFLTDVARLTPSLAALSQLVGKIWDAVNDPMVGVLSDKTVSRWGRRYPWMIYGAIPFGLFFFLQWIVPFDGTKSFNQWPLFWYYTIISILFNTLFTVVNLPYTALTAELTQDYNERTSLNSFRFLFSIGGSILSVIVAGIFAQVIPNNKAIQYLAMGGVCALLSIIPIYLCVWGTRARAVAVAAQDEDLEKPVSLPFIQQLKIAFNNRPFLMVVGIYLFSWLSMQLTATIIPYYVRDWMKLNDSLSVTLVILAVQGTAMGMLLVWSAVSDRVGKKATYFMGMGLWIIAQIGLFFLQPGQIGLMYVLAVLAGFGVSTAYLIPWSMLPDVVELDELRTGQRREGIFYSFMVFLQKICLGIAVALVLQSLGWAGYVAPTAQVPLPPQTDAVLWVIRIAIGPLPTIALIAGLVLAFFYPLTRDVHASILLQLRERKLQQQSMESGESS